MKVASKGDIIKITNYFKDPKYNMKYLYAKVITATNNGDYWVKTKDGKNFWFSFNQIIAVYPVKV